MSDSYEENKNFWRILCNQSDLISKLMAEEIDHPVEFHLPQYGKVIVTAKPAVPLGTNFMSFVFTTVAVTESGKQFSAFVKVSLLLFPFESSS